MTILERMQSFTDRHGKSLEIGTTAWRYYQLGSGRPFLWLGGGIRRVAVRFEFLEHLSGKYKVIAPDYPPCDTFEEFGEAFDTILAAEGVDSFHLGGQSYGGMLAQAYLARRPRDVRSLVLSNTGPANISAALVPLVRLLTALSRILPEKTVKSILGKQLLKLITVPESNKDEWMDAIHSVLDMLTKRDAVSHFAVSADYLQQKLVSPSAYNPWTGKVVVLRANNDHTQRENDIKRYEELFGRAVQVVNLGNLGHTAAIVDPEKYVRVMTAALDDGSDGH